MKYHGIGFSRGHILRMYETIHVHSSPELTRIVDIIIHNVLRNHVRRVRNSFYRYRFSFLHEQEIHFITTISDGESAAFNFSLNAMDAVKQHYRNLIEGSQYTNFDGRYGHTALASIHVVVGNFHFWEQSYDEAIIHYGIALDILEKNCEELDGVPKIDIVVQQIEVYLKQGSVAERVGNYSAAASIYMSAETIANNCLNRLNVNNKDSKWDVLRQPRWAKQYLNLKRSAIHYYDTSESITKEEFESEVTIYRKAVLSLFMENLPAAYSGFLSVASFPNKNKDSERSYFLNGNAYLKAGLSLLLKYCDDLHGKLDVKNITSADLELEEFLKKSLYVVIDSIYRAFEGIKDIKKLDEFDVFKNHELDIDTAADDDKVLGKVILLMKQSADSFVQGNLNVNAAVSYLSIVMMWEVFLEMLPWGKVGDDYFDSLIDVETEARIVQIRIIISDIRKSPENWIFEAQEKAFVCTGYNTGNAFSHFMKTVLYRNVGVEIVETLFAKAKTPRDMVLHKDFLKSNLYQHYSVFGQAMTASIYWEEIAARSICDNIESEGIGSIMDSQPLPYGIRYYSTMLWLKGRLYLDKFLKIQDVNFKIQDIKFKSHTNNDCIGKRDYLLLAANSIITFYRSSQYIIKTHGENSSMILPPLFIIYYNMWEVLFRLVSNERKNDPTREFEEIVALVRDRMDEVLMHSNVKDVSSRVLDLLNVEQMALGQLNTVERMGDQNSSARTAILRNKYYLDDDYEDNMFNLDWCYCRFFSSGAIVYRMIIKNKMRLLKKSRASVYNPEQRNMNYGSK